MQKLDVKSFALAFGVSFGIFVMFLGWAAIFGWGDIIVHGLSSFYKGYDATFVGGIIGGVWAFFDWGIGGAIIALVYNSFIERMSKKGNV